MTVQSETHLYPPGLTVARAAWLITAILAVGLYVVSLQPKAATSFPTCATAEADCDPLDFSVEDLAQAQGSFLLEAFLSVRGVFDLIFNLSFIIVALFIFWRKSDDWMALLLSLTLLLLGSYGFSTANELLAAQRQWHVIARLLDVVTYGLLLLLIVIFPNGRFAPRWIGFLTIPLLLLVMADFSGIDVLPGFLEVPMYLSLLGLAVYSLIYRYRRVSNKLEQQQTKWVAFGLMAGFVVLGMWVFTTVVFPPGQSSVARTYFLVLASPLIRIIGTLFPICVAVAALRYRLYDIDIIIRRTLVYSVLTVLLALLYFGSILLMQNLVVTLTGQSQSQLITVVTTLAIAALFFPLRNRVQNFIDHRFYRRKYDAAKMLAAFAETARDEVELEKLTERLLVVIEETMQPQTLSLLFLAKYPRNAHRNDSETPIS